MNKNIYIDGLVSVVIPAFNNANCIVECIESIQSQTYPNIEIIVIDDGSSDNTESILESLQSKYSNVVYKKIQNSKSPIARNTGFALAQGEYVCAIDADDIWPDYKLEMQVAVLKENSNSIVLGQVQSFTVDINGQKVWGEILNLPTADTKEHYLDSVMRMKLEQMVMFNTFMAPTKIILEDGLWNPAVVTAHDWENWIRLAKKFNFVHVNTVYQYYRKHNSSTTKKHKKFQALFFQLFVINLHSKDSSWSWHDALDYKRVRYDSWVRIYLYEKAFFDACKLMSKALIDSNMGFSLRGARLIVEFFAALLRSTPLAKR